MEPKKLKVKQGPEAIIQREFKLFLMERDWFVKDTHGSLYQSGFPDLYCDHPDYGVRWVEMKNPEGYKFTKAQVETFPKFNCGIWIITAATEYEYKKLFRPPNWYQYMGLWRHS